MKKQMIGLLFSSIVLQFLASSVVFTNDMWLREIKQGESAWITLTPELVEVFKAIDDPGRNRPALAEVKELVEAGGRIFLRGLCDQAVEEAVDYFKAVEQPSRFDGVIGKYQQDLVDGRTVSYPFHDENEEVVDQVVEPAEQQQQRAVFEPPRPNPRCTEVKCLCVQQDACIGRNLKVGKNLCVGGPVQLCARAKGCPPVFAKGTDECGVKQNRAAVKFRQDPQFSTSLVNNGTVVTGPLNINFQLLSPQLCVKAGLVEVGRAEARVDGFAEAVTQGGSTNLVQTVNVSALFPLCFCCPFTCDAQVLASFENSAGKFISPIAGTDNLIFVYGPIITVERSGRGVAIIRMTLTFITFSSIPNADAPEVQREIIQQIGVKANEIMRDTCINLLAQGVTVCR